MCSREAERFIFRSVGPIMVKFTRHLSYSQTLKHWVYSFLWFAALLIAYSFVSKLKMSRAIRKWWNPWLFPDNASFLLFSFPSERLLLPAGGTVFYWTYPEFPSWCYRCSRATCCLSKGHRNPQKKAECRSRSNSRPLWSSRHVCVNVCDAADVWLSVLIRVFLGVKWGQTADNVSTNPSCRCSHWLCTCGEGPGGVGEGAAEGRRPGSATLPALRQQRAMGGVHGGGRLQAHRIPRQR